MYTAFHLAVASHYIAMYLFALYSEFLSFAVHHDGWSFTSYVHIATSNDDII